MNGAYFLSDSTAVASGSVYSRFDNTYSFLANNRLHQRWLSNDGVFYVFFIGVFYVFDELRSSGAVARGVVMRLGEEPVCGSD